MGKLFRRGSRGVRAAVALLEDELVRERGGDAATFHGLVEQYGTNAAEPRGMGPELRRAVGLARDGNRWAEAVPVFLAERDRQPDFDVPYLWLADFLAREGRPGSAVLLARDAALRCARRSTLLEAAGEHALFSGAVREGVHLFGLAVTTRRALPGLHETTAQRAFLFLAELFAALGDAAGARWARQAQDVTELTPEMADRIRRAAVHATAEDRSRLRGELPRVSALLRELVPGED